MRKATPPQVTVALIRSKMVIQRRSRCLVAHGLLVPQISASPCHLSTYKLIYSSPHVSCQAKSNDNGNFFKRFLSKKRAVEHYCSQSLGQSHRVVLVVSSRNLPLFSPPTSLKYLRASCA